MIDEAEEDEERDGEEEAECCGDAGSFFVGPVAEEGGKEGGGDEGEEDEAGADGGPGEDVVDVEGEDGIPGCEEGGLREGAVERGEEAAGREEEDYGVSAFSGWGVAWRDGESGVFLVRLG